MNRVLAAVLLMVAPGLSMANIHWQEPWHVHANGQRLSVETFSSQWPPDTVAQKLTERHGKYQRYLVSAGRIVLSGLESGEHWLADIQGHPDGSQGYMSALYFDTTRNAAPTLAALALTPSTQQHLAHSKAGVPKQVFEFDSSAFVGLVAQSSISLGGPVQTEDDLTLIPSEVSAGTALAVFLPEP